MALLAMRNLSNQKEGGFPIVRTRTVIDTDSIGKFLVEGRSKGTSARFKPWLRVQGVPSQEVVIKDKRWKTGRIYPLLSSLEKEALFVFECASF
jgi:hypothetical protein